MDIRTTISSTTRIRSCKVERTRILIVEDDHRFGELQKDYLEHNGYEVQWVKDGLSIEEVICHFKPKLIILDLMLPGLSGFDICRKIRGCFSGIILFLSSSEDDIDHVACLEVGGDDFVNKPIRPRVLLARIQMLIRSREPRENTKITEEPEALCFGKLHLKRKSREVKLDANNVKLTASEFSLLWILARHPDQIMERSFLFQELRGIEFDGMDRSVDTKIVSLRKKLADTESIPKRIITVRNKGYLLSSDAWG